MKQSRDVHHVKARWLVSWYPLFFAGQAGDQRNEMQELPESNAGSKEKLRYRGNLKDLFGVIRQFFYQAGIRSFV